jgi:hypothetical protein
MGVASRLCPGLALVLAACPSSGEDPAPATPVVGVDAGPASEDPPENTDGVDEACAATTCPVDTTCSGGACVTNTPEKEDPPSGTPRCDVTKPWSAPAGVGAFNKLVSSGGARLEGDMLSAWFHGVAVTGGPRQLYLTTRTSLTAAFGEPVLQKALAKGGQDAENGNYPTISPDGLTIYFDSGRTGVGQIYSASRPSPTSPFGPPLAVSALADTKSTAHPYVQGDGMTIWFTSRRTGVLGESDIFRAQLLGSGLAGGIQHVPELSSASVEALPVVRPDGLAIWFARTVKKGDKDQYAVFTATRLSATAAFGRPTRVTELESTRNDLPTWIAPDGCTLYMMSDRSEKGYRVYIARRPK